jgi:CO/xanthine dehydrogenase Mo-binding subunit
MEVKFLGVPQEDAPFGAKGIGELTMIPWPAAVANAIYDAIGIQMDELPMSPDRIIAAVRKQRPDLLEKIKEYLKISS